jgi:hypothetical protein
MSYFFGGNFAPVLDAGKAFGESAVVFPVGVTDQSFLYIRCTVAKRSEAKR